MLKIDKLTNEGRDVSIKSLILAIIKFEEDFGSLDAYYKNKERRAEIDNELAILSGLYNTQEMEAEMERLRARQEARRAALDTKGRAKADKMTEKAAKKRKEQ